MHNADLFWAFIFGGLFSFMVTTLILNAYWKGRFEELAKELRSIVVEIKKNYPAFQYDEDGWMQLREILDDDRMDS